MGKFKYGYIIPIHIKSDLVFRAINSILNLDDTLICIATNEEISKWIDKNKGETSFNNVEYYISEDTSYPSLANGGIEVLKDKVEFISFLEFDDTVTPNAHISLEEWIDSESEYDIYMPLAAMVIDTNQKEKDSETSLQMISMLNEVPFAPGIVDEYGIMDFNTILKANFVFVNGCYFRPKTFETYGTFKKNFEILYDYEFIIRMIYGGADIISIPQICRFHYFNGDGEFERQKKLSKDDHEFWINAARREYMFNEDREIVR